jgi:hypothetical protein
MNDEEQQPSPNSIEEAVNQIKARVQNFDKLEEMAEEAQRRPDLFYIYAIYQIVQMQEQLNQLLQNIGDLYTDSDASLN